MRHLPLIFFLLFLVYQIVSAIINHVNATKQQQQRAEELARRRGAAGSSSSAETGSEQGRSRIDDLAARRKAQLEELRRRRDAARKAGDKQVRIGQGGSTPTIEPVAVPRPRREIRQEPASRKPQVDPWQQRQDAMRRDREAQQRRKLDQAREVKRRQEHQQANAARAEQEAASRAELRTRTRAAEALAEQQLEPVHGSLLRQRITSPAELQQLFVLKELIDPPLALRDGH